MAEVTPISKPPAGEIVSERVLQVLSSGTSMLGLARGFGGTSDPTRIWESMMGNYPDAFTYYFDLEEKDDDVGGLLETLKLAVLGRKRSVKPADDSSQAQTVADFVEQQLKAIGGFHQALHALLDAPGYGLSIAEINYDVTAGQVGLLSINDCPQEFFCFAEHRFLPQVGALRFLGQPYAMDGGELVPEEKFLIFSYNPRRRNRFGHPLLRRAFWPSWFKRNAIRFWLRYAEKGPGTAAVMYPQGAGPDEKKKALDAAEALIEKIAVAVPDNFKMVETLLTSARSQSPAVYERLVQRNELAIARAILGETLTSHGSDQGAGSYSLGQVHQEMFHQRVVELARALEGAINDQLVRRLVMWNFGPGAPMPKWSINTSDPEDLVIRVKIDQVLQAMGLDFTENYMRTTYGIPAPAPGDEVLQPLAPAAASATAFPQPAAGGGPAFVDNPRVKKDVEDVRRLMARMRAQAFATYNDRIRQLADEKLLNQGGAR